MMRSVLYAPGNVPKMIAKVATFGADGIVLDLEDAVPMAEKKATRSVVREGLGRIRGPLRFVRVNGLPTGLLEDDIKEVFCPDLDGIFYPKVEAVEELLKVDSLLTDLERRHGLPLGKVIIRPSFETAKGVLRAYEILQQSPARVRWVSFGAGDFMREIGTGFGRNLWDPDGVELQFARSQIVLASRAAGREPPLDTVYGDIRDLAGLERDARAAKRLGFQGKAAIYPAQVEVINRVFTPSLEEIGYARKVVDAFEEAEAKGSASFTIDGGFVDIAIVEKARAILKQFSHLLSKA